MKLAGEIFSTVGDVVEVKESLADSVTAVSGSGPAYFFYLVEAMIDAAMDLGLDEGTAKKLVVKTALGSAKLLEALDEAPQALRQKVTSKAGTTEAAIKVFEAKKLKSIIKDALRKAQKGDGLSNDITKAARLKTEGAFRAFKNAPIPKNHTKTIIGM